GGMIPVMLGTGAIMRGFEPFPLDWRTGATFVHDWTAIATWVVVAGHDLMAPSNPQALRGIVVGRVARAWAADHHPRWAEAQRAETAVPPPTMAALVQEEGQPWTSASG